MSDVPDADALEQSQSVTGDEDETPRVASDVPEADAIDQARPVRVAGSRPHLDAEVSEADAIDQALTVESDEDDEIR